MPFKSIKQWRFMESKASPLSPAQKREFDGATDFGSLPERAAKPKAESVVRYSKYGKRK